MLGKSGCFAFGEVLGFIVGGERNPRDWSPLPQLFHYLPTGSIRQHQITNQHVKLDGLGKDEARLTSEAISTL